MEFIVNHDLGKISGRLLYDEEDLSLVFKTTSDFVELKHEFGLSLAGTLEIVVDASVSRALYVSGYMPLKYIKRHNKKLEPPILSSGALYVHGSDLSESMTHPTTLTNASLAYDPDSQWLCIGDEDKGTGIEIADGVGIVIKNNVLLSVWLHIF